MTTGTATLGPVVALVAWTLVMLSWMLVLRSRAMGAAGIRLARLVGTTGKDAEALPKAAQWKAHNYNHLHEQPTLFYAVAVVLAVLGAGGGVAAVLAWTYVGLRIAHSIVQATSNRVRPRFQLFLASSGVLAVLTVLAAMAVLGQSVG